MHPSFAVDTQPTNGKPPQDYSRSALSKITPCCYAEIQKCAFSCNLAIHCREFKGDIIIAVVFICLDVPLSVIRGVACVFHLDCVVLYWKTCPGEGWEPS